MSKKCIQCGAELEDAAVFCDECGAKQIVESSNTPQEKAAKPQKTKEKRDEKKTIVDEGSRNSKMGVASLVFGIIAVCTVGAFFIPQVLGMVFGVVAVQNKAFKHNFAVIGIVLSVIAFLLFVLLAYVGMQVS